MKSNTRIDADQARRARRLWRSLEALHGLIYFVPEADEEYVAAGLKPLTGYFPSRAAAMGAVAADVIIATFYNFEPTRVRSIVPEAWSLTSPARLITARLHAVDRSYQRLFGANPHLLYGDDMVWAIAALKRAAAACDPAGRPLHAGHASLDWPDQPHLALWHGIAVLREHRGDGHVALLTSEGVSGCEALVLHAATGDVPGRVLQATRAWSDQSWADTIDRLADRGLVHSDGSFTDAGSALRASLELRTDQLAAPPWTALSTDETDRLISIGRSLSKVVADAGTFSRPPR